MSVVLTACQYTSCSLSHIIMLTRHLLKFSHCPHARFHHTIHQHHNVSFSCSSIVYRFSSFFRHFVFQLFFVGVSFQCFPSSNFDFGFDFVLHLFSFLSSFLHFVPSFFFICSSLFCSSLCFSFCFFILFHFFLASLFVCFVFLAFGSFFCSSFSSSFSFFHLFS